MTPIRQALDEFNAMTPGWDATGIVVALSMSVVEFAERLVHGVDYDWPAVFPLGDGGVLLIWERGNVEYEVHVTPTGDRFVALGVPDAEPWEGEEHDFSRLTLDLSNALSGE